jgi:hypothetical protein
MICDTCKKQSDLGYKTVCSVNFENQIYSDKPKPVSCKDMCEFLMRMGLDCCPDFDPKN